MKVRLKRVIASILAIGTAVSMLPMSVFAVQSVPAQPGTGNLNIEYFTSTLYNWNEDVANEATKQADMVSGTLSGNPTIEQIKGGQYYADNSLTQQVTVKSEDKYVQEVNLTYSQVAPSNSSSKKSTSYYYDANNEYKTVYYTRTKIGKTTTYTLYYQSGTNVWGSATYQEISSGTNGNDTVSGLYTKQTDYWLEAGGNKLESNTTYTSTDAQVATQLYYQSSGTYQGKGFYFTAAGNKPTGANTVPSFSEWKGSEQNWHIYSGLAASSLADSSNQPFSNNVNAARLFDTTGNAYTSVYSNVNVPFVYDASTGYYTLDSDTNAVYFGTTPTSGATMKIADKPAYTNTYTGFQPFANISDTTTTANNRANNDVPAYTTTNQVYGFGMVTQVPFQMTADGKDADGNPIQFEFCGDDDVWVYVDGKLALDIGGTHDAITGTIDFSNGDVTLKYERGTQIGDYATNKSGSTLSQENLYTVLGKNGVAEFAAQDNHTLTVYYMDRGRGKTNCKIRFNLPQKDSISVTKNISNTYTGNQSSIDAETMAQLNQQSFTYQLKKGEEPVANKNYSVVDAKTGNTISSALTDSNGGFKLKNGQKAVFRNCDLDNKDTPYTVTEVLGNNTKWTPSWSAKFNNSDVQTTTSENSSATANVIGNRAKADSLDFVCTNSYKYESQLSIDIKNKTVVLDYGLPTKPIDVTSDAVVTGNGEISSVELVGDNGGATLGAATVVQDNKIVYTPTKELNAIDTVTYKVTAKDKNDGTPKEATGTLTVIPATSVYYEEDFGTNDNKFIDYYGGDNNYWKTEGTSKVLAQEPGIVGTPNDSTYGSDEAYLTNLQDSNGTSKKADSKSYGAQFDYDFTGTGTAIYGRTSTETGFIRVIITNNVTGVREVRDYVNTQELYEQDIQLIDTRILGNIAGNTTLYNIPIYMKNSLPYGTYHVNVYLYKAGFNTAAGESKPEFYLDGIRVYNPVQNNDDANKAYAQDGEANNSVINIHEKVVADADNFDTENFVTLTDVNNNIVDVNTYDKIGANQEVYLNGSDNKMTFNLLNWDSDKYHIYLGLKAPSGHQASVTVGSQTIQINNSADCYYDITNYVTATSQYKDKDGREYTLSKVTVSGASGLAAVTNIKITGSDKFNLGYDKDINTESDSNIKSNTLYLLSAKFAAKLMGEEQTGKEPEVTEPEVTEPEVTEPEVTEPEVFTPERFDISQSYGKLLKRETIICTTSKDVSRVTINGENVHRYSLIGKYVYSYTKYGVEKGTSFDIVAYNADGTASKTYTQTAN